VRTRKNYYSSPVEDAVVMALGIQTKGEGCLAADV